MNKTLVKILLLLVLVGGAFALSAPAQAEVVVSVHGHYGPYYRHYYAPHRHYTYAGWRGGYWYHGYYGPRYGWYWVVGPSWYYYNEPIYPYPDAYVPREIVVQHETVVDGPAPAPSWYFCRASNAYYPYVSQCAGGWEQVPAHEEPPPTKTQ